MCLLIAMLFFIYAIIGMQVSHWDAFYPATDRMNISSTMEGQKKKGRFLKRRKYQEEDIIS